MKKLFLLPVTLVFILGGTYILADDDHDDERRYKKNEYSLSNIKQIQMSPEVKLYISECSACHMAYQKEFLPKRSWNKMMDTLENHFGVDATVEPEDKKTLTEYLTSASSKYIDRHITKTAASSRGDETPLRISNTPYFKKEHRKIPRNLIKQKEVKSIANCNLCHTNAQKGDYRESSIFIPNYGRWDD